MITEAQKLEQTKHLCSIYEQLKSAKTSYGAKYLACILGMWSQNYGVPFKHNPFLDKGQADSIRDLSQWWMTGWNGSYNSKFGLEILK